MRSKRSRLWIVAMPIGNPGDLSPRAREILVNADIVLAEDTRRAALMFQKCGLPKRNFTSFFEHNEAQREREVLSALANDQSVALISDAGTPLIADPGFRLIQACRREHFTVSPVPGPSAPIAAISASGLAPLPFTFLGFLPRSANDRKQLFCAFAHCPGSIIFFERKDRVLESLQLACAILGDREFAICRELTKEHEEFIIGRLDQAENLAKGLLGELTVIIAPAEKSARISKDEVIAMIRKNPLPGLKRKIAAQTISAQCPGWNAREIYNILTSSLCMDNNGDKGN